MHLSDLRAQLQALGANPAHAARVLRQWSRALPMDQGRRRIEDFLPLRLRQALPQLQSQLQGLVRLQSAHPGADGSQRLLLALADGQQIEAVLLPPQGLCVSTQVGCAVGCVFCMTGQGGVVRQLGSAEIVAQVVLARQRQPVRRVVFMGMGEPAHNLDAVLEAIDVLGQEGGIGHKELVFSTVGDPRVFTRLAQALVRPALALSLHSGNDARRRQLLPRAPAVPVAELVESADAYARATGYPLQVQWTLLEDINDGDDEVQALIGLLAGRHAVLNFIPWNHVEGLPFKRPSWERAAQMARALSRHGILTKLRRSAGQDVDGGCGQLRARAVVPRMQRRLP